VGTIEEEQVGLLVEHTSAFEPVPVDLSDPFSELIAASLPRSPKAVLFDVYGTLLISASGEIGSAPENSQPATARSDADGRSATNTFLRAFELASGSPLSGKAASAMARLYRESIEASHAESRAHGFPYPEVDIVRIWRRVITQMSNSGLEPAPVDVELLAIAYEVVANPSWPMPGSLSLIQALCDRSVPIGIVSNAQFYTPLLFRAFFGRSLVELGFDPDLLAFSFETGRAKPDPALFDTPLASLRDRGIDSTDTVYVGNDVRNDVLCARAAGCMTVLFAGDARSLRLRTDDDRVAGTLPDSVITRLSDLPRVCRME
jgi:putative hydrolase of the HAD superfamily